MMMTQFVEIPPLNLFQRVCAGCFAGGAYLAPPQLGHTLRDADRLFLGLMAELATESEGPGGAITRLQQWISDVTVVRKALGMAARNGGFVDVAAARRYLSNLTLTAYDATGFAQEFHRRIARRLDDTLKLEDLVIDAVEIRPLPRDRLNPCQIICANFHHRGRHANDHSPRELNPTDADGLRRLLQVGEPRFIVMIQNLSDQNPECGKTSMSAVVSLSHTTRHLEEVVEVFRRIEEDPFAIGTLVPKLALSAHQRIALGREWMESRRPGTAVRCTCQNTKGAAG
jgi:hypothetical protein